MNRDTRLLTASVFVTNVGIGAQVLATGLLLYRLSGSALAFATTLGLDFALGLAGQFFGASILDRAGARSIATFTNLSRGALVAAGGVAAAMTGSALPAALPFVYASAIRPVHRAAVFSLVPEVARPGGLTRVNALRSGALQLGQLVGAGFASLVAWAAPPASAFAASGVFFALGGVLTLALHADARPRDRGERRAYPSPGEAVRRWREVVAALTAAPSAAVHLVVATAGDLAPALVTLLVVPRNESLGGAPWGLFVLDGGFAVGALTAAAAIGRRAPARDPRREVAASLAVAVAGFTTFALATDVYVAALGSVAVGWAACVVVTRLDTSLQRRTAPALVGRVALGQDVVASVAALAVLPLWGGLVDARGATGGALAAAALVAAYTACALLAGARRAFGERLYEERVGRAVVRPRSGVARRAPRIDERTEVQAG